MNNEMKCSYCDGHGEVAPHILDDQPCPVCKGTGKKLAAHAAEIERLSKQVKELNVAIGNWQKKYEHVRSQRMESNALITKITAIVEEQYPDSRESDFDVLDGGVRRIVNDKLAAESKLSQLQLSNEEKAEQVIKYFIQTDDPNRERFKTEILAILNGGQQ